MAVYFYTKSASIYGNHSESVLHSQCLHTPTLSLSLIYRSKSKYQLFLTQSVSPTMSKLVDTTQSCDLTL